MIWLIGAGPMAIDYVQVLKALKQNITVIGRSQASADNFTNQTGIPAITGGLTSFLATNPEQPDAAIVATSVEQLSDTAVQLINFGVKRILLEKPGGLNGKAITQVADIAKAKSADVMIAYNRRYYSTILAAKDMIEADGGVTSFNFEITEWGHVIEKLDKDKRTLQNWFLANTTHVIDAAFFLGGTPRELNTYSNGSLAWHPSSSIFAGAGVTDKNALFSYTGNWEAPGRWSLEILTAKRRYIFRPFEQLHVQEIGSVAINRLEIDDSLDQQFKPGLYLQCKNFLTNETADMCSIKEQLELTAIYEKMAGY